MLIVRSPRQRMPERNYIYQVLLGEFLGLEFRTVFEDRSDIEIAPEDGAAAGAGEGAGEGAGAGDCAESRLRLRIEDILLQTPGDAWLTAASLPRLPLELYEPEPDWAAGPGPGEPVPVLYGRRRDGRPFLERTEDGLRCGVDVFGSSFFMLTRYEELVLPGRDRHDRMPAAGSIAARSGSLDRPVVNLYAELLWAALQRLWPCLARRKRSFRLKVSHDVDVPFLALRRSRLSLLKESLGDAVLRRSPETAWRKARMLWRRKGGFAADPFNSFDWLMQLSEAAGSRSAFYFITEDTAPGMDGNYTMNDPEIAGLLREIHRRGHEIGLHPGYHTYLHPERIRRAFELLRKAAAEAGAEQEEWGGRQHYLRWRAPDTWQHWEDAGLHYDSTLSYADRAGFRCGTCYEYPVFNLKTRKPLRLRERPLIVMDQSVLHPDYMGLRGGQAAAAIRHYYSECAKYNGDFTLLWHNSQLIRRSERRLYRSCIEEIARTQVPLAGATHAQSVPGIGIGEEGGKR
ncbi:polysaccharide deacetylase family protein [Paenibacillus caui]|uniref:polysaccharide deacetylase family protein n=1 Tax=Paenibacillus caui TaxID=2873927 RepID=UPI001CA97BF0|nr:polysaccharide deacetylase family protein [Paenibacillus caui]